MAHQWIVLQTAGCCAQARADRGPYTGAVKRPPDHPTHRSTGNTNGALDPQPVEAQTLRVTADSYSCGYEQYRAGARFGPVAVWALECSAGHPVYFLRLSVLF